MRIVQLSGGSQHGWTLQHFAYIPIDERLTQDSSDLGKKRLGEAILGAVEQAGIKTKNIALGLPATKTFTSIVETETLPEKELKKSFKYEIDKYVPMAMSDAKAHYVILGPSPNDPAKTEVLVSSVAKDYAESTMEMIEKTGLNIVAMEPEPLAMVTTYILHSNSKCFMNWIKIAKDFNPPICTLVNRCSSCKTINQNIVTIINHKIVYK